MWHTQTRLWRNDNGATAVEFALIATLIAVAVLVGAAALGNGLADGFQNMAGTVDAAAEVWQAD